MQEKITPLPLPFVTNVTIDARAADVSISVDPAMLFTGPIAPGEKILENEFEVGVSLNIQKGKALSSMLVMENDKAVELVEALVTCIVRGDPKRQERAEALMEGFMKAVKVGFESPCQMPGQQFGCVSVCQAGGDNAQTENQQGRVDDGVPGGTQDDSS